MNAALPGYSGYMNYSNREVNSLETYSNGVTGNYKTDFIELLIQNWTMWCKTLEIWYRMFQREFLSAYLYLHLCKRKI